MLSIESVASICHEANRQYCRTLGDHSQPSWNMADDWQKNSAIDGVKFHLANPEAGPAGSHENWMKGKLADGWKLGEVKDPEKKEHPCMVPYKDLPLQQQIKDFIFVGIVHGLRDHIVQEEAHWSEDLDKVDAVSKQSLNDA